jgi:hypothetical protein
VQTEEYPRDVMELEAKFATEKACRLYLRGCDGLPGLAVYAVEPPGRVHVPVKAAPITNLEQAFFLLAQQAVAVVPITYEHMVHPTSAKLDPDHKL